MQFEHGTITKILREEKSIGQDASPQIRKDIEVSLSNGEKIIIQQDLIDSNQLNRIPSTVGAPVVIQQLPLADGKMQYQIIDTFRLPSLAILLVVFFSLVIVMVRKQGFLSFISMLASFAFLIFVLLPALTAGYNPILITLGGAAVISAVSMYLTHGIKPQSHIALASILIALIFSTLIAFVTLQAGAFTGLGSEEAIYIQVDPSLSINARWLLLGGILLGTLSILDDIAVAQVSMVFQLKKVNKKLHFKELYEHALHTGKDHVASLVNTLVLAYAGASLPLFLLFTTSNTQPLWVTLNSEMIAEEIVRSLVGSIGLVLTVPLSTLLAASFASKVATSNLETESHAHIHE